MKIHTDQDASLEPLQEKTVAVPGSLRLRSALGLGDFWPRSAVGTCVASFGQMR